MAKNSGRPYDVVLFGASGWAGMFILDELARVAGKEKLKWAVAGRNRDKIQRVLSESAEYTGVTLDQIPILIADVFKPDTLVQMAEQTSVLLNAVGPFGELGEPVVKACLETNTHHLDIAGEIQYLEGMQLQYNEEAKKKGVFMIGALGLDSVLSDLGVFHSAQHFPHGFITNVECHYMPKAGPSKYSIHDGTLRSIMGILIAKRKIGEIRKQLFPKPLPRPQYILPKRPKLFRSEDTGHITTPFSESDGAVVNRSLRHFMETGKISKPIEFKHYIAYQNWYWAMRSFIGLIMFGILMCFAFGREMIKKFPDVCTLKLFSKYGPTRKQVSEGWMSMKFLVYGFRHKEDSEKRKAPTHVVTTQFVGPDSAYQLTAISMVQAAITVLREIEAMTHSCGGGVLTPAVAFDNTKFLDRLASRGVKYQLLAISDYRQP